MIRNQRRLFSIFVLLLVAMAIPASATRVRRLTLDEVRDRADRIVIGQVIGVSTRLAPSGESVWTDYEIRVAEQLTGEFRPVIIVSMAGGEAGGLGVAIAGVPKLSVGQKYAFFLYNGNPIPVPTVGWGQGIFELSEVNVAGVQRNVLISIDGEPLEITADQKIMRGPAVLVSEEGTLTVYEPEVTRDATKHSTLVARNADGSIAPAAGLPVAIRSTAGPREYATLDDLRAFVNRQIESAAPFNQ